MISAQDLTALIAAVFITGMIWLRSRMYYAQRSRGVLRLKRAGRTYFAAVIALLAVGWVAAPALARAFWPAAGVSSVMTRVVWFLCTYYVFILVHRMLQARRIEIFGAADTPPKEYSERDPRP